MPLASSSLAQLVIVPEVTFGVIPTTGNHSKLRFTGESLSYEIQKETSAEINSSRSTSSKVPVSSSTGGDIQFEMSYKEYDPLMEAMLQSTYTVFGTNGVGAAFIGTFTATTITASVATTGTSNFTSLRPGQFFELNAPGHANHGKIFRVSSSVAPTATVITVEAATPLATGTSIAACSIATSRLTNGTTQKSFTIERQSPDIGEYWAYSGEVPGTWELNFAAGSLTTHSISFMGRRATRAGSTQMPGTAAESSAFDVHSSASGSVCILWVDGAPLVGTFVESLSMSFDNAIEAQTAMCDIGAVGIRSGTIACTGSMSVYFANGNLFDKFSTNTNIALTFSSVDAVGNGYVFSLPKVNISSLSVTAGAKDQNMMLDIEFEALRDLANSNATLRQVLFIDRVGVAV